MHHATLRGELPALTDFDKIVHRFEGGTVVILKAFRAVGDEGYLFLTLVEEDAFRQHVLIEARPNGEGGVFVGLKPFGDALSTTGTSEAVDRVVGWLCERGLEVEDVLY